MVDKVEIVDVDVTGVTIVELDEVSNVDCNAVDESV